MERTEVLELMSRLKLYGMRAAYDEVIATAIKRRHESPRIVGDLLSAEIAEKQARSIKYQLTIAKLPLAKDIDDFDFTGTPVNQAQIRDLANGAFLAEQRNAVLVGGTGTGKSHSPSPEPAPRRCPWPFLYRRRPFGSRLEVSRQPRQRQPAFAYNRERATWCCRSKLLRASIAERSTHRCGPPGRLHTPARPDR
jgi:IstB-like ATP binding protein